jgi:hypothetical protein
MAAKLKSFGEFNDCHNKVVRAFVRGARLRAHAGLILKKNYGYSDEQLRMMVAANQPGVQTYGARKVVPMAGDRKTEPQAVLQLGRAVQVAKQRMLERLMRRCHVKA